MGDYISYYTVLGIHDKMDFHQLDNAHAERITKNLLGFPKLRLQRRFYLSVFKPYYFFVRVVCAPVYTKSKFEYIKPQFVKLITPASVNVATTGVVIDL